MRRLVPSLVAATVAVLAVSTLPGVAGAATVEITMQARSFVPEETTARTGDQVVWRNTDSISHTVTADDGRFDVVVEPGRTFTRSFASAGTVDYYCRFHGSPGAGMAGTVEVVASSGERTGRRLSGPDRIATAIAISEYQFPDGANEVYLARSDVNPDALVGGSLTRGPILLVPACGDLPASVAAEIRRLDPSRVVALGGVNTVCDQILQQAVDA